MQLFNDKIVVITGGGAGIGRALCEELAHRGAVVFVADIHEANGKSVAAAIAERGGKAHFIQVDVSSEASVRTLIETAVSQYGRIDYLFNNAGIAIGGDVRDLTLEHWHRVLEVNLNGVIYGSTLAYQHMTRQGYGHIINTASATGLVPQPGNAPYCASKHAVVGLSLSLRAEGADLGVKVSAICPGRVQTDIFKASIVVNVSPDYVENNIATKAMDASEAVRIILDGVARNQAIIIFPFSVRMAWHLHKLFPRLMETAWVKRIRDLRRYRHAVIETRG